MNCENVLILHNFLLAQIFRYITHEVPLNLVQRVITIGLALFVHCQP